MASIATTADTPRASATRMTDVHAAPGMSAPDVQGGEGGGGEGDGEGGGEGGGEEGTPQGPSVRGSGCAPVAVRCRAVAAERPRGGGLGQWRVPEFVENQNWPRYWFAITFDPPLDMLICAQ